MDKCEIPGCEHKGVPGNENVINGIITCDYCDAKQTEICACSSAVERTTDNREVGRAALPWRTKFNMENIMFNAIRNLFRRKPKPVVKNIVDRTADAIRNQKESSLEDNRYDLTRLERLERNSSYGKLPGGAAVYPNGYVGSTSKTFVEDNTPALLMTAAIVLGSHEAEASQNYDRRESEGNIDTSLRADYCNTPEPVYDASPSYSDSNSSSGSDYSSSDSGSSCDSGGGSSGD